MSSEIAGDAAIYFDPFNAEEMAQQMAKINEDSELRKTLISKGKERVNQFSWDKSAEATWEIISKRFV